jgi:uncharacterized protein YndB with AHSA1/START domain
MSNNQTKITVEPGKQELTIVREFDAPRELVFQAHTDSELFAQWLGPRRYATEIKKFEPRDGGSYRFVSKDSEGNEFGFHGVYHEVSAPEKIIWTFEYEELPEKGHVSLETGTFEALPGERTRLVSHSVYLSVADRDGMVESGMEEGVNQGYERLDELLEKMKKKAA